MASDQKCNTGDGVPLKISAYDWCSNTKCQFAKYPSALITSPCRSFTCTGSATNAP
jgi:hypothetical protein